MQSMDNIIYFIQDSFGECCICIIKSNSYKLHTYIHYNYSIKVVRTRFTAQAQSVYSWPNEPSTMNL